MDRKFDIGDRVICTDSGVIGKVLKFYNPTACEEQTLVKTDDGREYHAPTRTWIKDMIIRIPGFNFEDVMFANNRLFNKRGE